MKVKVTWCMTCTVPIMNNMSTKYGEPRLCGYQETWFDHKKLLEKLITTKIILIIHYRSWKIWTYFWQWEHVQNAIKDIDNWFILHDIWTIFTKENLLPGSVTKVCKSNPENMIILNTIFIIPDVLKVPV
jgi:hypothetical protein